MKFQNNQERRIVAGGLFVLSSSLAALGAALSAMALDHMAFAASLCGPLAGHCLVCFAAVGTLAAAVAAGLAGASLFRPGRRLSRVKARSRSA
ncbi:hypothetical protein [Brevundimonas sp. R86498]|uniref:hypothetical protein n=1 Tax=Brevundimonas sp. R86498 TaxID=3093845 RepID=UPI0037C9982D